MGWDGMDARQVYESAASRAGQSKNRKGEQRQGLGELHDRRCFAFTFALPLLQCREIRTVQTSAQELFVEQKETRRSNKNNEHKSRWSECPLVVTTQFVPNVHQNRDGV